MERRLKIGEVSMHHASNAGKDFGKLVQDSIPEGVKILKQQENFERGSIDLLLYSDDWDIAPNDELLERVIIEAKRPVIERI